MIDRLGEFEPLVSGAGITADRLQRLTDVIIPKCLVDRVALKRYGHVLLHTQGNPSHTFFIEDDSQLGTEGQYVYVSGSWRVYNKGDWQNGVLIIDPTQEIGRAANQHLAPATIYSSALLDSLQ